MKNSLLYLLSLCWVLILSTSCTEEEKLPWQSGDYIHFAEDYPRSYSFVYAGSTVERDTLIIPLNIAGNLSEVERSYKVKQAKTYGFVYEYDNLGNRIDSAFIELPNQAIPGEHYVDISSYEESELLVPANALKAELKLVLLRAPSLEENDYTLTLEIEDNGNFKPGYGPFQRMTISISDQISRPKSWDDRGGPLIGSKTLYSVLGFYGEIKHQLLIDVTGKKWNDNFILNELTEEYLIFYKNMAARELQKINEERAAEGLHKLREDDNNPNSEIRFF